MPGPQLAHHDPSTAIPPSGQAPLVCIRGLSIGYVPEGQRAPVRVVRDVDLTIERDEILGLVGESGSGKTQTARAILRLNSKPLRPLSGEIILDGANLLALPEKAMRTIRGGKVAMIFQDPRSALNPLMKVGDQLARVYALHQGIRRRAAYAEAIDMLRRVGITGPERVAQSYPHQLSGGMCQRVMISMGLGIRPQLLIADEPTTGLDVTIQAQILELIKTIQAETAASILLITHDLGVVAEVCQRVAVMYAGRIVEVASAVDLFGEPRHPYTLRLLKATLSADGQLQDDVAGARFPRSLDVMVGGQTYRASLDDDGTGTDSVSALVEVAPGHLVRCRPAEQEAGQTLDALDAPPIMLSQEDPS